MVELGTVKGNTRALPVDCRNETDLLPLVLYAYVKRRHTKDFWTSRVVPVHDGIQLSMRDQVLVNIQQCSALVPTQRSR